MEAQKTGLPKTAILSPFHPNTMRFQRRNIIMFDLISFMLNKLIRKLIIKYILLIIIPPSSSCSPAHLLTLSTGCLFHVKNCILRCFSESGFTTPPFRNFLILNTAFLLGFSSLNPTICTPFQPFSSFLFLPSLILLIPMSFTLNFHTDPENSKFIPFHAIFGLSFYACFLVACFLILAFFTNPPSFFQTLSPYH